MAITLKELAAGQNRLEQQDAEPLRMSAKQFAAFAQALKSESNIGAKTEAKIFEEFVKQTQKREELLKDATEEQKTIFKELEESIKKLRSGNREDSTKLKASIDGLTRRLAGTAPTAARSKMLAMATPPGKSPNVFATPAKTPNVFAPQLSPTNYDPFGDATTVGSVNKALGTAQPAATAGGDFGLGAILGALGGLLLSGFGKIIKAIGAMVGLGSVADTIGDNLGGPGAPAGGAETDKKKKGKAEPRARDAKGRYTKAPNPVRGRLLGGLGLGIAGMAADYIGDKQVEAGNVETGSALKTVGSVAGYAGIGGTIGTVLGMVGGPAGMVAGAALGTKLGAAYGAYKGIGENYFDSSNPAGSIGFDFKRHKVGESSTEMKKIMMDNQNLMDQQEQAAPVIINQPQPVRPIDTTPMIFAPGPSVRPTESALESWISRGFHAT
jgi:hypothetical protein